MKKAKGKTMTQVHNKIVGQEEVKKFLDVGVDNNMPVLLVGETGTGKTSLVRDIASDRNKTYTRFSITGETTVDDFVGKHTLKDGNVVWQDGILLTAAKNGHYLVVDEINAALPEILFVLHSLLDDDKYIVVPQLGNKTVKPHKNFRFFATMNPVDEYAGTKELNKAFMSRFAMVLEVDYPETSVETQILIDRCGVDAFDARQMVDVAIGVRRAKHEDKVFYTMSTRDLIYWGKLMDKLNIHEAFRVAVRNKSEGDAETVEKIYASVMSDYKKPNNKKMLSNLEKIKEERKELERQKENLRDTVRSEVKQEFDEEERKLGKQKAELDKEKLILQEMETKIKAKIRTGLKG